MKRPMILLLIVSTLFMMIGIDGKATPTKDSQVRGEVIDTKRALKRQVGGGKAVIELYKEGKNAFIGRLRLAPLAKVPKHKDPTEEYLLIEQGTGEITIDGEKRIVKTGDLIYMPAQAEVSFTNSDQALVALQIFAGTASARKYDKWSKVSSAK